MQVEERNSLVWHYWEEKTPYNHITQKLKNILHSCLQVKKEKASMARRGSDLETLFLRTTQQLTAEIECSLERVKSFKRNP